MLLMPLLFLSCIFLLRVHWIEVVLAVLGCAWRVVNTYFLYNAKFPTYAVAATVPLLLVVL